MELNAGAIRELSSDGKNIHCSVALVDSVMIEEDEVLLRVTLQPTGEQPTIRMGFDYVGNGFGMYVLPNEKDEILCMFPNGDLNRGICVKRLNNGVDKHPEKGEKGDFGKLSSEKILLIGGDGFKVDIIINGDVKACVYGDVNLEVTSMNIKTGITK